MPTDIRLFQLNTAAPSCLRIGTLCSDDLLNSRSLLISSTSIGILPEMARKNMSAPIAADGNSRTICDTATFSPLNADW